MIADRRMSLAEAIRRFVPDGASVVMGTCLESMIPFAAGHELIRQRKRDLTLMGPISDILFDQLIGAGCVARIQAAWVGNVSAGLPNRGFPAPLSWRTTPTIQFRWPCWPARTASRTSRAGRGSARMS